MVCTSSRWFVTVLGQEDTAGLSTLYQSTPHRHTPPPHMPRAATLYLLPLTAYLLATLLHWISSLFDWRAARAAPRRAAWHHPQPLLRDRSNTNRSNATRFARDAGTRARGRRNRRENGTGAIPYLMFISTV